MPPRSDAQTKKPSGGRPLPRRLFSFDSIRKERSSSAADDNDTDSIRNPFRARQTEKTIQEHPDDPFIDDHQWTEKQLVTSPEAQDGQEPVFKVGGPRSRTAPVPLDLSKPNSIASDSAIPASPSKRRWDTVRYHVLPAAIARVASPPLPSSDTASIISDRPSTPRLYKFGGGKKQFRHVVETAQAENKKLSEAIWKMSWALHGGEAMQRSRPEREPTLATLASGGLGSMGSSLHLPFMASSSSLSPAGGSGPAFQTGFKGNGLRRPQSIQSLATLAGTSPSIHNLAAILQGSLAVGSRTRHVPHEGLVLSALLSPFLSRYASSQIDGEQRTAVETFEMILRSWKAPGNEVSNYILGMKRY